MKRTNRAQLPIRRDNRGLAEGNAQAKIEDLPDAAEPFDRLSVQAFNRREQMAAAFRFARQLGLIDQGKFDVRRLGWKDRPAQLSSPDKSSLERMQLDPAWQQAALRAGLPAGEEEVRAMGGRSPCSGALNRAHRDYVMERFVNLVHQLGAGAEVWTVQQLRQIEHGPLAARAKAAAALLGEMISQEVQHRVLMDRALLSSLINSEDAEKIMNTQSFHVRGLALEVLNRLQGVLERALELKIIDRRQFARAVGSKCGFMRVVQEITVLEGRLELERRRMELERRKHTLRLLVTDGKK
jgi:hypothetical protein